MKRFGEKLRQIRIHHGLTQLDLARRCGYQTHSYVNELEAGRKIPTVGFVLKVSDLFSVSLDDLLKDNKEVNLQSTKVSDSNA